MPKIADELSPLAVKRLTKPGLHFVGGVPGLALQVTPTSRSWVLRVAVGGKRREVGLGGFTTTNGVAEARKKALKVRAGILDGVDPVIAKRSAKAALEAARLTGVTFKQAAESFISANGPGWKNAKHAAQWTSTLSTYAFPTIGNVMVADVTTAHVLEILTGVWSKKPETASRVRQRIEKVISAADAAAGRNRLNPARWEVIGNALPEKSKIAKVEHHAALPWKRVPAVMAELKAQRGNGPRALRFAILTAARSAEVRGMTWAELDVEQRIWIVPGERMKMGVEHRVPLSAAALAVLLETPEKDREGLVFPGARGGVLSENTLVAVLRRMGLPKGVATAHGFRSSFRDWAGENTHYPRELLEKALAHKLEDKVEAAYQRSDLLAKRAAVMNDWAAWCERPPAEVVSMKGKPKTVNKVASH